jgi:hypothetical protein
LFGIREIKAALSERTIPLPLIERDRHEFM